MNGNNLLLEFRGIKIEFKADEISLDEDCSSVEYKSNFFNLYIGDIGKLPFYLLPGKSCKLRLDVKLKPNIKIRNMVAFDSN